MTALKKSIYDHIRRCVISGEFLPGTRLYDAQIASEIGVSRTPVREVIGQLVSEGMLEQVPHLGVFVRSMDEEELRQLFEFREMLECFAIEIAARKRTPDQLAALQKCYDEMVAVAEAVGDVADGSYEMRRLARRGIELDHVFHQLLFEMADNCWVRQTIERTAVLDRFFSISGMAIAAHQREVIQDNPAHHVDLLDAVRRQDGAAARRLMSEATRRTYEDVRAHLSKWTSPTDQRAPSVRDSSRRLRELIGDATASTADARLAHTSP